jgi:hypothetical protein
MSGEDLSESMLMLAAMDWARGWAFEVVHKSRVDGMSAAAIADHYGVEESVVVWWLSVARLPPPHPAGWERVRMARGMLRAAREAAWRFAQVYG